MLTHTTQLLWMHTKWFYLSHAPSTRWEHSNKAKSMRKQSSWNTGLPQKYEQSRLVICKCFNQRHIIMATWTDSHQLLMACGNPLPRTWEQNNLCFVALLLCLLCGLSQLMAPQTTQNRDILRIVCQWLSTFVRSINHRLKIYFKKLHLYWTYTDFCL